MTHRIAFAGFRHPHILGLWKRVREHPQCEIVGAWEDDLATREQLQSTEGVNFTRGAFEQMLAGSGCTIVAIGEIYARRGAMVIASLKAGKHVISDKPICTSLAELDQIELLSKENNLSIGCQLDLVESGSIRRLREVILQGKIGPICTVSISAQHPLRFGSRAAWYFVPGLQGGTINDIGVHAFDLVPWLTGIPWKALIVAREWNAKAAEAKHFKDCAQFLGVLENGASCFADLSYLAPDKLGYELPQYWRVTVHGAEGMAETSYAAPRVTVVTDDQAEPSNLSALVEAPSGYLQDFLDEITGLASPNGLTSKRVISGARLALEAQAMAQMEIS